MNQLNIQLKVCSKCKLSLSVEKFSKCSSNEDGLQRQCKSCKVKYDKEYYQNNKAKILELKKKYHQDNKAKILKQAKEYYQDNKVKILEYNKEYRQNNPDKIKAKNKAKQERYRSINLEREKTTYFEDIKYNPKRCPGCKQIKTCADFNKVIITKDGLSTYCRYCDTQSSIDRIVKREKDNPNFKFIRRFQLTFSVSLKQGEVIPALKTLMKKAGIKSIQELTGVKTIQIARKMLLKTMPQGYTEQDWINQSLHVDHREPVNYFIRLHGDNLKLALIQANQITNLRLITAKENLRKNSSYALMPDNTELLYEDWVKTKAVKING